ncbi:MAG: nickel-dependent lactate racemase [Fibrobacteres bacterium]|nr:nickel-dependent lactate racemase [Fibrobacterota bacterium]
MNVRLAYGKSVLTLELPENAIVYEPSYPVVDKSSKELLLQGLEKPIGCDSLRSIIAKKNPGNAVVVVSDITRPVPYKSFLLELLNELNKYGLSDSAVTLLVATGMHRESTAEEKITMFGREIVSRLKIVDHNAENAASLKRIDGKSASGNNIEINRIYAEADLKILTGLVEPHFMAGFSGGRKSICPGICSLDTLNRFHGAKFLSNDKACNGLLSGNPLHEEAESIAKAAGVDFIINVVLDKERRISGLFCGELDSAHQRAVDMVLKHGCMKVQMEADLAVTSCGGSPLDETFYQCGKGIVSLLPAIKKGGTILAAGSCLEGIGSHEYEELMKQYSGRHKDFINDIVLHGHFTKDQWQFQMLTRAIDKVGIKNLHFYTDGIEEKTLGKLSVVPHKMDTVLIQREMNRVIADYASRGLRIAVFPEGPYCAPL